MVGCGTLVTFVSFSDVFASFYVLVMLINFKNSIVMLGRMSHVLIFNTSYLCV